MGRLPELTEASRLFAASDLVGALSHMERAAQVVEAVPMPPLRLAAYGAMSQMLRAAGRLSDEAAQWRLALEVCGDDPELRAHALNGAISSALHRKDPSSALDFLDRAPVHALPTTSPVYGAIALHRSLANRLDDPTSELVQTQLDSQAEAMAAAAASGLPATLDLAEAACEGTRLLLGDVLARQARDEEARDCWSQLLPVEDAGGAASSSAEASSAAEGEQPKPHRAARAMRVVAAHCRIGRSLLRVGDKAAARRHLAAAVDECDGGLPSGHPLLPHTLAALAEAVAAEGEFVAAEGLYRSAIETTTAAAGSAADAALRVPSLRSFARLLDQLETNGRTRHAEAELLRGRAAQLQADFPEALALSGSNGGALEEQAGEAWFGLEPWYAADCDFDWLAAARPV